MNTKKRTINSKMSRTAPPREVPSFAETSAVRANGRRAMIPTIMMSEIPLPIPLSVMRSPSHMMKSVPAIRIITEEIQKNRLGFAPLKGYIAAGGSCERRLAI